MEESIEKFIVYKSNKLKTFLLGILKVHDEIISPVEKLFFLEWHFRKMFHQYDKHELFPQYNEDRTTGKYIIDFVVIDPNGKPLIAIEIDGHDFHEKTKEQVRHDKERERFITKSLTKLLRFSGSEVFNNPEKSVNEVVNLINEISKK